MATLPNTVDVNATLAGDIAAMNVRATFMSLVTTLVGGERLAPGEKRGGKKLRYGDATVRDTFVTGISRVAAMKRRLKVLNALTGADLDAFTAEGHEGWTGRGKNATKVAVTRADFDLALSELIASAEKSRDGKNSATHDHVFEGLVVDGERVRGGRVYIGNPNGPDAASPGTIYLHGVRVGRKVLKDPVNGWLPASKSAAKTVAKRRIERLLPRYVSYRLEPGTGFVLNVGAGAAVAADADGVTIDSKAVDHIRAALVA
jgi:hypothetical protein